MLQELTKSTESIQEKVDDVADKVNQDERAQAAAAGILKPIYQLAERFSFSSFHWIAFALMATGVVAFALQLVIGKLLLIFRMELDLGEILSDEGYTTGAFVSAFVLDRRFGIDQHAPLPFSLEDPPDLDGAPACSRGPGTPVSASSRPTGGTGASTSTTPATRPT